jgi:hypothetical protein
MKSKILLLMLIISTSAFSQSITVEPSFGVSEIGKNVGESYGINVGYELNKVRTLYLSHDISNIKEKNLDIKYNLNKTTLLFSNKLAELNKVDLDMLVGFSYIVIEDKLPIDKNKFTGFDLGMCINFYSESKVSFGAKIVNTFSTVSPGGMRHSSFFVKFRLK